MRGWLGDDKGCTAEYIIRILDACGRAVKLGYMRPFVLRHDDLDVVEKKIKDSVELTEARSSFESFRDRISKINLLEEDQ